MSNFAKLEILSATEIALLQNDVAALKKALTFTIIAAPIIVLFTMLSFYFSWGAMAMLICVVLNLVTFYIMLVSYWQSKNIFADLKQNSKAIVPFTLTHKQVMGYVDVPHQDGGLNSRQKVRRVINLAPERIQQAVDNDAAYQKEGINIVFNEMGIHNDDELLKYTYQYRGCFEFTNKEVDLFVPIQYYLMGNIGDRVLISYAPNSKKVFAVYKN